MSTDHAAVKVPPPFIHAIAIAIGFGIQRFAPMPVVPASVAAPLGITFVMAAFLLGLLSFRELRRAQTTIRPDRPTSAIVKTGPYRFSRNPLYVSLAKLHLGIGLWTNSLWVVLMLLPALVAVTHAVVGREESYLERRFGDRYLSYKSTVRRWI